jgi:hypothetical protein
MNLRAVVLCLPTFLAACGASKAANNVTLLVQKPSEAADSCLGVVGFEVEASAAGKMPQSGSVLNAAAVQTVDGCRLARPFTIEDLDIEGAATVTVRGFDGAHQPRVSGTTTIANLHVEPTTILLKVDGTPAPPLILNRQTLLAGTGIALSDVASMTIETAKGQPMTLLSVMPTVMPAPGTRPFFEVDPGGFGVEGVQNGEELTVGFTFLTAGRNLPKQRVITVFDGSGPVYRVQ